MFPGMEDLPPTFATEKPENFDHLLPVITLNDVEMLRLNFPDLAKSLSLPEENALSNLLAKSFNQSLTQEAGINISQYLNQISWFLSGVNQSFDLLMYFATS